jgi:hypothetical protein
MLSFREICYVQFLWNASRSKTLQSAFTMDDGKHKSNECIMVSLFLGMTIAVWHFIIEGKEEKQQVTGGFIGHRKYNVNRERLDEEIENLKSEGFEVLRTT